MKTLKHRGMYFFKLSLAVFVVTALLLWGWNSAMPDLFALPEMRFKQALGLVIVISIASFLFSGCRKHYCGKRSELHRRTSYVGSDS